MNNDYARLILQTFEHKWDELTWEKQRHFAYRAQLVSNHSFWINALHQCLPVTQTSFDSMANYDLSAQQEYGRSHPRLLDEHKPNDARKLVIYEHNPEIIFWGDFFNHWRYLFLLGDKERVTFRLSDEHIHHLTNLIFDKAIFSGVPVWSIECLTDMRWLMGSNKWEDVRRLCISELFEPHDEGNYWNYVYALTHVVIGESHYYTSLVSSENWAIMPLIHELEENMSHVSADIVEEIGVCIKLCGLQTARTDEIIFNTVRDHFDEKMGLVNEHASTDYNLLEHRNILAVLALSDWSTHE